jgi:hypothetical protein
MKIKGISPIEQHVEKLVLVVFALFAMAMFVLQFNIFGDPNAVQIEQGRKVSPGQAVDAVRDMARRKEGEIDATPPADEVPDRPGPLDRWTEASRTPAVPPALTAIALMPGAGGVRPVDVVTPDDGTPRPLADRVLEIAAPTPTDPFARVFGATVNPLVPSRIPESAALLPGEQPLDLRAVSIQATFPADQLRAALAEVPAESSGLRPLPRSWWIDQVEILDVEVARDELGPDGAVVATTIVPPVPGAPTLRARITTADLAPRELPEILTEERIGREQIRRSPFFDVIAGEPWIWPALAAERDAADPNREAVQRLVAERSRIALEIARLEQPRKPGNRPEEPENDGPGAGGGPGPSPAGGPRPPSGGGGGSSSAANIAKRIEDLRKRITEIETRLREEFQRDAEGQPLDQQALPAFAEAVTSLTAADAPGSITVWTHDLQPEHGKTYQYRVRIWITNPLFGHADQIGADQRSDAGAVAIASEWSDPTSPVTVFPSPAVFVASATTGEGLGGLALRRAATASLDVFAFHYGFWRVGDITVSPGDQLRAEIAIPAMPRYEVIVDDAGVATVGEPTPGPATLPMARDVFVVGVIPPASGSGDLVFFARPDGSVEVRRAGVDAESDAAARMRDSAAKAESAQIGDPKAVGRKN